MDRRRFLFALPPVAFTLAQINAAPSELVVDAGSPGDPIRPLHGVNGGPLAAGGLLDLSAKWKEAGFPLTRLHDCHWPNPDVVDVHTIFPNPSADPSKPESYDFERTDEYVKSILDTGAKIVYRLGESIEHQKVKRNARPPKNAEHWAAVCAGIVRHYTEGWANGHQYPIKYWEIWNEPDNRPTCWTGTDDDYFQLYAVTSKTLKKQFPKLLIGGPGLGNSGTLKGEKLETSPMLKGFLAKCREMNCPLDFLSWHCYTADADELVRRGKVMRQLLDAAGFKGAESHLNEWNYLPDNSWNGMMAKEPPARQAWHDRIGGAEGAAFTAASLICLQDAPIDVANYFSGEAQGMGLFTPHGQTLKTYHAFCAFGKLAGLRRLPITGQLPAGVTALAGIAADKSSVSILFVKQSGEDVSLAFVGQQLPWDGATLHQTFGVDGSRNLELMGFGKSLAGKVSLELPKNSIRLVEFRREKPVE
ncbi:GH39 family glycosyl hydrolase [Zavarzinella formosa]|uniref:GH39 family glycosyl hydrolase n=1 Tax=Zavarzinella formosa TaxID=360055 RepID=UPI0002D89144|nr:glycosyl hydrolase [Zavarzinella formosa]